MEEKKNTSTIKTVNFVNIPQELKANAFFCLWKKERRNGKPTKVPYNPKTGARARTNDPFTFSDFNTAMTAYAMGGWNGIGYRVSEGIGAIDIDHCIREDGSLNDVAASILSLLPDTYFEKSPSGTGLRGFFRLSPDFAYDKTVYYINNRKLGLEVYLPGATNRFVTVTGDVYRDGVISRNDEALLSLLDTFMKRRTPMKGGLIEPVSYLTDEQVLSHAYASASGEKFKALFEGDWEDIYDSQSDADMALVSMLAFWCGNVEEQIDRIFRTSGLMRDKWDRQTGDATYGQINIRNAVALSTDIYLPVRDWVSTAQDDFNDLDDLDNLDNAEDSSLFRPDLSKVTLTLEEMKPHTNPRYGKEEIGIGNAFADYYKPIARYVAKRGIWYVYDGMVWRQDDGGLTVAELAKILADRLYNYALQIHDEDTRTRYIKRIQKLQLRKNRVTMVAEAKSVHPISSTLFDSNKYLFNCKNGTLNLKTLEFRPHDPKDFITKCSPVYYDPEATSPRWIQFVDEVMMGKTEIINYFQKAVGYALSGDTSQECLFIMHGPTTRNGKTTTIETLLQVMGEYGISAKPDLLASNFFKGSANGGPTEDVARLNGARFVGISEMEKKLRLNASLTKLLTGNNRITARYLHENSFSFYMQAKIFIDTNHLPNADDSTLFDSNRMRVIPFNRHFEEHEQDKTLKTTLKEPENLSGILNWMIEGYHKFCIEGLEEPKEVLEATERYREDSDRIGQFITQCLCKARGQELKPSAIYTRYREWCGENGYRYEGAQNFYKRLGQEFVISKRRPWLKSTVPSNSSTRLVDDVAWVKGEEPEIGLIPES